MKKISLVWVITMMLGIVNCISAFAIPEVRVDDILIDLNFDNETLGEVPTTLNTRGNVPCTDTNVAQVVQRSEGDLGIQLGNWSLVQRMFNGSISSGVFYIEFDVNPGNGGVNVSLVYSETPTVYRKYVLATDRTYRNVYIQKSTVSSSPTEAGEGKITFTAKNPGETVEFVPGQDNHYKLKIDIDNQTVTAYINNVESEPVSGISYIGGTNPAIGGIAIYSTRSESATDNYAVIDNIKVYREPEYRISFLDEDFEDGNLSSWQINNSSNPVTGTECTIVNKSEAIHTIGGTVKTQTPSDPDNKVLAVHDGKAIYAKFINNESISSGVFYVEFDAQPGLGNVYVGVVYKDANNISSKYPFSFMRGNMVTAALKKASLVSENLVKFQCNSSDMTYTNYNWVHVKLKIDLDNQTVTLYMNGQISDEIFIEYLGGSNAAIGGIGLYNVARAASAEDKIIYFDNIKVYAISDGISITEVKAGENRIELTFKDAIQSISKNDISIKSFTGTDVSIESVTLSDDKKSCVIYLAENLLKNKNYTLMVRDSVKYTDGYAIIPYTTTIVYTGSDFTATVALQDVSFVAGSTVKAVGTVHVADLLSEKHVKLIIATYDDDRLLEVNMQNFTYDSDDYGEYNPSVPLTLTKDAKKIKAFIWDANTMAPLSDFDEATVQ